MRCFYTSLGSSWIRWSRLRSLDCARPKIDSGPRRPYYYHIDDSRNMMWRIGICVSPSTRGTFEGGDVLVVQNHRTRRHSLHRTARSYSRINPKLDTRHFVSHQMSSVPYSHQYNDVEIVCSRMPMIIISGLPAITKEQISSHATSTKAVTLLSSRGLYVLVIVSLKSVDPHERFTQIRDANDRAVEVTDY